MALRALGLILGVVALALGLIGVFNKHLEGIPFAMAGAGLIAYLLTAKRLQ